MGCGQKLLAYGSSLSAHCSCYRYTPIISSESAHMQCLVPGPFYVHKGYFFDIKNGYEG